MPATDVIKPLIALTLIVQTAFSLEPMDSLTLEQAKTLALENAPNLKAAQQRIEAARAVTQQIQATWFPTVSLVGEAAYNKVNQPDISGLYGGRENDDFKTLSAGINASWLLYDGFNRRFTKLASEHSTDSEKAAYKNASRLLTEAVAFTYFNILLAKEEQQIAEDDAQFNRELSREAKLKNDAGTASKSELLNFKIRTTQAESVLLATKESYNLARLTLIELIGAEANFITRNTTFTYPTDTAVDENREIESYIQNGWNNRADLNAQNSLLAQLEATAKARKSGYHPKLLLGAGYNKSETFDTETAEGVTNTGYLSLNLSWDLFTGHSTRAELEELHARTLSQRETVRSLRVTIAAEIRRAYETLKTARRQMAIQQNIYDMTSEVRDLVRKEYKTGKAPVTRLNEAQTDLNRASGRLALAKIRFRQACETLNSATGNNLNNLQQQ